MLTMERLQTSYLMPRIALLAQTLQAIMPQKHLHPMAGGISGIVLKIIALCSRKPYNSTILPQIRASAIPDFYNQNTGDPTDGAYSNLDLNFGGNTVFACVGGCYLPNGTLVVTYTADQAVKGIIFATPAAQITQQNILDAYNQYIQYTSSYGPSL